MTSPSLAPTKSATSGVAPVRRQWVLRDHPRPAQPAAYVGPNWFTTVMGTGIVAVATAQLPVSVPGQRLAATAVWILAVVVLVAVTVLTAAHWWRHTDTATGHLGDPVLVHFFGAPPMALMTVGAGTLLVGEDIVGEPLAVTVHAVLWSLGTLGGLATTIGVPYLLITRHDVSTASAGAWWLMPVVPPMVSAATGALLLPHVAAGQPRLALMLTCWALFGISLLAALVLIPLVCWRLVRHGTGPAPTVPTLFIVLGPLGQSVTAAVLLSRQAPRVVEGPYADVLAGAGLVYGIPVLGFALAWLVLAAALVVCTARSPGGLPFALTWWSFTFPLGTCVTGASALAVDTDSDALSVLAVLLFSGLLIAWLVVAARTLHGAVVRGSLLLPPR